MYVQEFAFVGKKLKIRDHNEDKQGLCSVVHQL